MTKERSVLVRVFAFHAGGLQTELHIKEVSTGPLANSVKSMGSEYMPGAGVAGVKVDILLFERGGRGVKFF